MALNAIEKLKLSQQLGELMKQQRSAGALQRLSIGQQIIEVMKRLGYGVKPSEQNEGADPVPQLVSDFLADKFLSQTAAEFTETLAALETYVSRYITLDQIKDHAAAWVDENVKGK